MARLDRMKTRHALIGDVPAMGLAIGVELVTDRATKAPACAAAEYIMYREPERSLNSTVTMGNVPTLTPPLITTSTERDAALDIVEACIADEEGG